MLKRVLLIIFLLPGLTAAASKMHQSGIDWQDWSAEAFEQAKRENKIILLNVGMEGCAACYRMDTITYADEDVMRLVNDHFVTIAVDSEARPDIGERYMDWAWPATIFMAPDTTQVLAVRGNRLPRNFIPILRDLISRHENGTLEPDPDSPYTAAPEPVETELTLVRDHVRAQLDRSLNRRYGGWNRAGIGGEQSGSRLRHLYMRAHMYDNADLLNLALKGSEGYLNNLDKVWGGVYSRSFADDYENTPQKFALLGAIPEKRISAQANAVVGLSLGYELTSDKRYREGMREMHRFMVNWFTAPGGAFFTNQRAQPENLPDDMNAGRYWSLNSDAERRKYGTPPVDHAIYTDKNGEMIAAYVMAYEAFGNPAYLDSAIRAAKNIMSARTHEEGWMAQAVANDDMSDDLRLRPYPTDAKAFLNAQAWFGQALLALHRVTGDKSWLEYADRIGAAALAKLYDSKSGGFYAVEQDETAAIIKPRKPLESNGTAASFYFDLAVYTKNQSYADVANRTLSAVAQPEMIRHEGKITGELAIALEKVTASYVEFSIVGDASEPKDSVLFQAGLNVFEPRKLLHFEDPGRYPKRRKPAMYICNPNICSIPIEDPAIVAEQAALFRKPMGS